MNYFYGGNSLAMISDQYSEEQRNQTLIGTSQSGGVSNEDDDSSGKHFTLRSVS